MIPRVKNFRMLWFALVMLMAPLSTGYAWGNGASSGDAPQWLEGKVERLQTELTARGFDVARGAFKLFTIDDCQYPIAVLGNCLGNNPAAPYVIPTLPLWPDEFVDERMKDLLGPQPNNTWATFRLDKREAVVIVGLLPPPGRYFGLQTYVFTRTGALDSADPIFQKTLDDPTLHNILFTTAPNPSRVLMFSSIGNSNNNVTIERQSGAAFGQQRSFVISTDAAMAREVTDALARANVSDPSQVFSEPVSPAVARVGLGAEADDFMTLLRYAQPNDPAAGEQWRRQIPLAVLRVRSKNAAGTEPWPAPAYDPKTARAESGLGENLAQLVTAIKQQWGQPSATVGPFQSLQTALDLIGQHCLARPMNCLGDTQDADYQVSPSLNVEDGKVIAVAGTLGTATGNATYVGLSVNRLAVLKGVANLSDTDLQGSASGFAGTVGNTDKLYVHYFARDCSGIPDCQEITEDMVPRGDLIKIIQRNYVVPGTARGADPAQVQNPAIIVLDGAARPASR